MYSIFLADNEIEIIQSGTENNIARVTVAKPGQPFPFWDHFLRLLTEKPKKKLVLASTDPGWLFRYVASFFDPVEAAGGLVINEQNKLLLIFRQGKWDLPKGHGGAFETTQETALREVMEETGVEDLAIIGQLPETYHVFEKKNGGYALKKTWWYLMKTGSQKKLKPQLNEDITRAEWIDIDNLEEVFANTYGSVKFLIDHFNQYLPGLMKDN